jgi:hypothetical protein
MVFGTHNRILSLKPDLRLEWPGQDGQDETKWPDHSASLGHSVTSSIRIGFSVHTSLSGLYVALLGIAERPNFVALDTLACQATNILVMVGRADFASINEDF